MTVGVSWLFFAMPWARLPCMVGVFTLCCKIHVHRIQEHVNTSNVLKLQEDYDILIDCQHVFRIRRSCESHLLTVVNE